MEPDSSIRAGVLLETLDLTRCFGGLTAVDNCSIAIRRGELRAIIGPNGSGKTTLINLITGVIRTTSGTIALEGKEIGGLTSHRIGSMGISRTFQQGLIFNKMTVLDNVLVGRHLHLRQSFLDGLIHGPRFKRGERSARDFALLQLESVGLLDRATEPAAGLTHVQQRLLEIARALATEPKVLFLDEPTGSMNVEEADKLVSLILSLKARGMTIVFVEHNMRVVMGIAEVITVLSYGKKIAEGTPAQIQCNSDVIEAYLGRHVN